MAYVPVIETITQQFVMLIYFHVLGNIRVELKILFHHVNCNVSSARYRQCRELSGIMKI